MVATLKKGNCWQFSGSGPSSSGPSSSLPRNSENILHVILGHCHVILATGIWPPPKPLAGP